MTIATAADAVWEPQPKQAEFLSRGEDEVLYGGAAGGGKSEALVIDAARQVHIPRYRGLLLRKTYPQLTELIDKSLHYYPLAFPGAKYNAGAHTWTFPSGAKVTFGSLQHKQNVYDYQGRAFDFIGFDELTHFTADEYMYLLSRNRPNCADTRVYMRATANPGGIGHAWVKDRFVMAAPPGQTVWEAVDVIAPDGSAKKMWKSRIFVPSSVFDNTILMQNDPGYVARLASLPEAERNALLYGDWDSYSGQYFREFRLYPDAAKCEAAGISVEEAKQAHRWTHVIPAFEPPRGWRIYRSYDFGYARPFSCAWWAVDYEGVIYRILELYGCTKTPNEGVKWTPEQQFRQIREVETTHPWLKGKTIQGVADPAIWDASHGVSIAETASKCGVYFTPGDHERIPGWMQCHYRLQFDKDGYARMYVFDTCAAFIRTVPPLMYSETHVEDVDTSMEDHVADEWRYFCMSRPVKALEEPEAAVHLSDPLNQLKRRSSRYG